MRYMQEFHKKHSPNDLYGLPKTCQESLDLALTYPDAKQIIQNTTDPGTKARFQHIHEARVLSFEVNPYTNIDDADLHFSLETSSICGTILKLSWLFPFSALLSMKKSAWRV
ncbi:hypothetical protein ACFX16_000443 [Malus domestica]